MKIGLSTAFNIHKYTSWKNLVNKIKSYNVDNIELSIHIPDEWFFEIQQTVKENEIEICTLHNFCPLVKDVPEGRELLSAYLLTSKNDAERQKAIELTKKTIIWAKELNAKVVILHAGEIQELNPDGKELWKNILKDMTLVKSKEYIHWKNSILLNRAKKVKDCIDTLLSSLDEILNLCDRMNILLGLENRFFVHEIPNLEEIGFLLDKFKKSPLRYWHDIGHAEVMFRTGFVSSPTDYLKLYSHSLIGLHLHDVKGFVDHYAPGTGEVDFISIKPYLSEEILAVLEVHSKSTEEELTKSIQYIHKIVM